MSHSTLDVINRLCLAQTQSLGTCIHFAVSILGPFFHPWDPRSIYLHSFHTHTHAYKCTYVCTCANTYTCTPRQMGDPFERSPWPQLGNSKTRDEPIRGVSVRQTHAGFPSVFLPRSKTPSCQQCTPIWTHTYIHTIHACIHASWLDVLVYGGGNRRQRERKIEIGSGDDWLMTTYICTLL